VLTIPCSIWTHLLGVHNHQRQHDDGARYATHASTEAELSLRHKGRPFVILQGISERIAEHKTTDCEASDCRPQRIHRTHTGVAVAVRTMRVQLTSLITLPDVNLREVALARNLHIIRGLDEVDPLQRAVGNCAGSATRFCAPCDLFALRVADRTYRWRSP